MRKLRLILVGSLCVSFFIVNCGQETNPSETKKVSLYLNIDGKSLQNFDAAVIDGKTDLQKVTAADYLKLESDSKGQINFSTPWDDIILVAGKGDKIGAAKINLSSILGEIQPLANQTFGLNIKSMENSAVTLKPQATASGLKLYKECRCSLTIWKFRQMCCYGGPWYQPTMCLWVWHDQCIEGKP